jgi:hypothetical protein
MRAEKLVFNRPVAGWQGVCARMSLRSDFPQKWQQFKSNLLGYKKTDRSLPYQGFNINHERNQNFGHYRLILRKYLRAG